MNGFTAIVAEDEAPQRQALLRLLRETAPDLAILAECEDGLSALEALRAHRPTVAFLDIRMPGLTGLMAAALSGTDTHIVFTTAYSEHALRAFEMGAIDYLLKPVSGERLQVTLDRLRTRLVEGTKSNVQRMLTGLGTRLQPLAQGQIHWVSARCGSTVRMIPLEEIVFFQSSLKYTRVVTARGESIIRTPLKELICALDPREFWQVHRSVIVRVPCVRAMHALGGERFELDLIGTAERVPVSAVFKGRFRGL